jgi:hypothetical protein
MIAAAVLAAPAAGSRRAPPPLSSDATPADIASTFGSGSFGRWVVDRFGLPAYEYLVDEQTAARAHQPELNGATTAQHELGNDHIKGAAFNDGYTELWSQDRLAEWTNKYMPAQRHYTGGYGYLRLSSGRVVSTLYLDRPRGARESRRFGVGYYERTLSVSGVAVREDAYAPFGNDPVLLHDVTLRNTSRRTQRLSWFEYWDVNPYDQTNRRLIGLARPVWNPGTRTLSARQLPGDGDSRPMTVFASALSGPLTGVEASSTAFFGSGTRARPAAVVANRLSGAMAPRVAPGSGGTTLFAFRAPVRLAPGASVTLRYAYGLAYPGAARRVVRHYAHAARSFAASERAWARWLPHAWFGPRTQWVSRELEWDGYLLRAATVDETACGYHTITQGGYYEYSSGLNLGSRSWLHYLLRMVYADPATARDILRYSIVLQSARTGAIPYGTAPLCRPYNALGISDDLNFWLLLASAEYGLGTRDVGFFNERLPFVDSRRRATIWQHLKLAYRYQESLRGPHNGYLALTNGDWSDFSARFLSMTESMLVTAQLAYAYPQLAALADRVGDHAFARTVRARARTLLATLRHTFTGRWYLRGYSGSKPIGHGTIFGEPQPWAILAGAPTAGQARVLVASIRRYLTGIGAPPAVRGPARIGSAITPALGDPGATDPPTNAGFDGASQYVGGVWFDVNGWLTWSLLGLQGVVPGAAGDAWSEYTRNTLAMHAHVFPDSWDGTISIDDACNAFYSAHPDRCGIPLYNDFDGQITEQPTWMVMNAIHFAGVTPTARGFTVVPHGSRMWLRLPDVGVSRASHLIRGYFRVVARSRLVIDVGDVPRSARGLVAWANGHAVAHRWSGGHVRFALPASRGRAADWAVSWT